MRWWWIQSKVNSISVAIYRSPPDLTQGRLATQGGVVSCSHRVVVLAVNNIYLHNSLSSSDLGVACALMGKEPCLSALSC